MSWKCSASSVTGRSHTDRGERGQDYSRAGTLQIADRTFFIGLAADGAGSTTDGGRGAEIACETIWRCIIDTLRDEADLPGISDDRIKEWVTLSRDAVKTESETAGKRIRDYACTLLGAVCGESWAVFFQIGDGAIVVKRDSGYDTIFWPEQGEYANTTFFLSDEDCLEHLMIRHGDTSPAEIALFTDGLQTLALSFSAKQAHAGFFGPLFTALRRDPGNEFSAFSQQLTGFLKRSDVSARSDDDKTLVLAVRD